MIRQYGGIVLGIALSVIFLTTIIYFVNIGQIKPVDGSYLISAGKLCDDEACVNSTEINLPFFKAMQLKSTGSEIYLQFPLELNHLSDQIQAIYLPKIADNVAITINGIEIRKIQVGSRYWNRPILVQISDEILHIGQNQINITLVGPPQEGLELFPFFIGPRTILKPLEDTRTAMTIDIARLGQSLMVILFVVVGGVWLARRNQKAYLWLSLSCVSAFVVLDHLIHVESFMSYKYETMAWTLSIFVYVFFTAKFVSRVLFLPDFPFEKINLIFLIGSFIIMVAAPAEYIFILAIAVNVGTVLMALNYLALFWIHKEKSDSLDFVIFFGVNLASLAMGLYEQVLDYTNEPSRSLHLLQYVPLALSCACLWLIMSQLVRSLSNLEQLTDNLNATIAQKTAELTLTYKNLAQAEKHQAIDEERQRIMLDLHDGIGGQLVNTLAYMENKDIGDDTLRTALEDALRDLALMLDSLENDDSITTLLGMMRTRLETLLSDNGLKFNWQISKEPILPNPGPSQNLNLARIVQEAITNIIKHADASVITVSSNSHSVVIKDNGKGFDLAQLTKQQGKHGIIGMRRRAAQIGGQIELASSKEGTQIFLVFPKA